MKSIVLEDDVQSSIIEAYFLVDGGLLVKIRVKFEFELEKILIVKFVLHDGFKLVLQFILRRLKPQLLQF